MIVVTTNDLPGHRVVRVIGLVRGITVRSMRNKANRLEELFVRLVESGKEAA